MAWDSSFKNILTQLLGDSGIKAITETDIATSNQRIDFVILKNNPTIETPFKHAKKVIIGEFKSENDKLYDGDLLMLISKAFNYIAPTHGYGNKKSELHPIDISTVSCILFLGGKKSIVDLSSLNLKINKIEEGTYEIETNLIHILILEIDNMKLSGDYEALKMFATVKIRGKTMKEAILHDNRFINSIGFFLYKDEFTSMAKAEGIPLSSVSLSIRSAVETIGISKVIEEVGLSKVIEEVGLKELSKHLTHEQIKKLSELKEK